MDFFWINGSSISYIYSSCNAPKVEDWTTFYVVLAVVIVLVVIVLFCVLLCYLNAFGAFIELFELNFLAKNIVHDI